VTNSSSKITFNTAQQPSAALDPQDIPKPKMQRSVTISFDDTQPKPVAHSSHDNVADGEVGALSSEEAKSFEESQPEYDSVKVGSVDAEPYWKATPPQTESAAQATPEWQAAMEPNPFYEGAAHSEGFAETGLMAARNDGFVQRNGTVLAVCAVVLMTFLLGSGVAMILLNGDDALQTAQNTSSVAMMDMPAVEETATRSVTPDMTQVTDLPATVEPEVTDAGLLSQSVLAGLTPAAQSAARTALDAGQVEALTVLSDTKLRTLREAVLADLYDFVPVTTNGAERIEFQTPTAKLSTAATDAGLVKAIEAGQIELGRALRTADGAIDTATLVFDLVQKSLFADQTVESAQAAMNMSRRLFAASTARTQDVNGARVYTVKPGDSLAYISLQFFGKADAYKRIMQANPETLHSPDQIQIGQRIVIPS